MSRNLLRRDCAECPGSVEHIILEETPRPITLEETGPHLFGEYKGLIVANAHCGLCHTLYLAWIEWPGHSYWERDDTGRHLDLSYRNSFNDEPVAEDTPLFKVEQIITYRRAPANEKDHTYRLIYMQPGDAIKEWKARQKKVMAEVGVTCPDCDGDLGGDHLDRLEEHKPGCPRFPL